MRDVKRTPSSALSSQIAGRLWKFCMGLFLAFVGGIFVQYLWNAYQRASLMDDWVETPCEIVSAGLNDSEKNRKGFPKYILEVEYLYDFGEKTYSGSKVRRLPTEGSDLKKIAKKLPQYPAGSKTVCYVDPDAPETVVLRKDSKGSLYSIWFPCVFVIGGLGMMISAFLRQSP